MQNFRIRYIQLVLLPIMTALAGCGTITYKAKIDMTVSGGIVWPGKPEKPRIRYLWSLQDVGTEDSDRKKGVFEILGGKETETFDVKQSPILLRPQSVYVDDRRFYIADPGALRVTIIDRKTLDVMHITETDSSSLESPISVVAGFDGRVYVSDPELKRVMLYSEEGKFLSSFDGDLERPSGLAIDRPRGIVYVVDTLKHAVHVYDINGKHKSIIGKRGDGDGEFNYPGYAFVDVKGNLYVSDSLNFRIQVFSPEGKFLKKMGTAGDSYDTLAKPKGVAVDSEGNIYIVDAGQDMIKIFNQDGRLLLFFGEKGHRYGDFYLPTGIFIDSKDVIYVADTINMRIQAFQFLGGN